MFYIQISLSISIFEDNSKQLFDKKSLDRLQKTNKQTHKQTNKQTNEKTKQKTKQNKTKTKIKKKTCLS